MVLIPEVPLFFKKGSLFGVTGTLHTANTETRRNLPYLFGFCPLEDNTEYLNVFFFNIKKPNRFGPL